MSVLVCFILICCLFFSSGCVWIDQGKCISSTREMNKYIEKTYKEKLVNHKILYIKYTGSDNNVDYYKVYVEVIFLDTNKKYKNEYKRYKIGLMNKKLVSVKEF